jgi:phage terminase large subunit GpA-like protein
MISLSKPVAAYLRGRQDPTKKQAFINQHKARAFKTTIATQTEKELLKHRNDIPPGIVPAWATALTAGVDVQKRGFWFVVRAWDGDLNSHLVEYGYLSTFGDVRTLIHDTHFPVEGSTKKMRVWRAGMDTGGGLTEESELTRTEEIYVFITKYGEGVIHAVKGASRVQFTRVNPPKSMEKLPHSSKPISGGMELRTLDTHNFKKLLHSRLEQKEEYVDEDGTIHEADIQRFYLNSKTGMDYAKQFMAEELREDRNGKQEWKLVKQGRANHLLDCEVMAAACADNSWAPSLKMISGIVENKKPVVAAKKEPDDKQIERPTLNRSAMSGFGRPSWLNR